MQRWARYRIEMVWTYQKQKILGRGGKNNRNNTQNYPKKILMTQIIMMV